MVDGLRMKSTTKDFSFPQTHNPRKQVDFGEKQGFSTHFRGGKTAICHFNTAHSIALLAYRCALPLIMS